MVFHHKAIHRRGLLICYYRSMMNADFLSSIKKGTDMTITQRNVLVVTPADNVPGPGQGNWTYEDYAALPDDGRRYEIVNGVLFMTPSPNRWHQKASSQISRYLLNYVQD